ncbi:MAG: zinc ribbon domain-containing protein [Phycisphaerae bacterium]|nr:zinc ribbon domain-containing protein [Phycisphaerae bacterium]
MPTYDYECTECGHAFEKFQSITAPATRKCPACKKNKVKRLIGAGAGIIFKGSGFYQTDYRSSSYKQAAEKDSKASSPKSTSDTKADKASSKKSPNESKASSTKPS